LTAFRAPDALKVHFRCIYDGLLFRRFRSQVMGVPKKISGWVRDLLRFRRPTFRHQVGSLTLHCVSGQAIGSLWQPLKKGFESKMGGAGVFSGTYLPMCRRASFCTARFPFIGRSPLPPFLFPGARQVRLRGKVLVGLGMEESQKFCVHQERRRRKECSFHGCIKGSARVPGSFSVKLRIKNLVSPSVVCP